MGPLNGGWTIAKRLLQHERSGLGAAASGARADPATQLPNIARVYVETTDDGGIDDGDLRERITRFEMEAKAFAQTIERAAAERRGVNRGPSPAASIMKQVGSFLRRDGAELTVEMMGGQGLGWEADPFTPAELAATRNLCASKAGGIAGGSQEVQWNIISKRILNLPDSTPQR